MRTLVVGDIHGALKALQQCFERAEVGLNDLVIFLGDYVDGWPESAELIEFLIEFEKKQKVKPIFIRGNHDKWCEDWLKTGSKSNIWISQGGKSTFDSYIKTKYLIKDSHRMFFHKMHNYYVDDKNRGFVHGGFRSKKGLGHEAYESDYYWDRDLWQLVLMLDGRVHEKAPKHAKRMYKHNEIYIGHTSTFNWDVKPHLREYNDPRQPKNGGIIVPMKRCNVWNLDTGAGYDGRLSIMNIDTESYWQSDDVKTLYPNDRGR